MRSLILAAALALPTLALHPTADACGGAYEVQRAPSLFMVSTHDGARTQTFVLLNQLVDEKAHTWSRLETMSYDHTKVAPAPALTRPVQLTLLGTSRTTVVSTTKQVLVKEAFARDHRGTVAMQVPSGDFRVAVFGAHADYAWHELETPESSGNTTKKRAGDTELLTTYDEKTNTYATQVKHRGWSMGSATGHAFGVITADGISYAVIANGNALTTISLGPTATPRA